MLVAAQAPVRRALAAVCGRLQEIKAFERLGFARLRDYAAERLGISARQVHEFARMDRAFQELPQLEDAFLLGVVGWAKARDLARVATSEDVEEWLAAAAVLSSDQLAREVRAVDQRAHACADQLDGEEGRCESVRLRVFRKGRARVYSVREFASRVCGERVSLADAMDAMAAEFVSAVPLEQEAETPVAEQLCSATPEPTRHPIPESAAGATPCAPPALQLRERLREVPPFLQQILAGLSGADAFQLDERLRRLLHFEQRFEAEIAPLLAAIAAGRGYRQLGFPSMAAYSNDRTGAGARKTSMLLRLQAACELCPPLNRAFRSGELSWMQAYTLVPIARLQHAHPYSEAWIRRAREVTVLRLEEDVAVALAADVSGLPGALDPGRDPASRDGEVQVRALPRHFDDTLPLVFSAPINQARFFKAVVANTQRRIEQLENRRSSEAEAFEVMVDHFLAVHSDAHREWTQVRAARLNRIFDRDGWRCSFPGCSSYRHLEAHHIQFRSAGGSDRDDNLTVLCRFHHQRGIHAGIVSARGRAPDRLHFALGLRRGSRPLQKYTSGDRLVVS